MQSGRPPPPPGPAGFIRVPASHASAARTRRIRHSLGLWPGPGRRQLWKLSSQNVLRFFCGLSEAAEGSRCRSESRVTDHRRRIIMIMMFSNVTVSGLHNDLWILVTLGAGSARAQ